MPPIFQGVDPIFLKAQTFSDTGPRMLLICADRTCNAAFEDTADGWPMALQHATLKHGWRDGREASDDTDTVA